jgi:hypothetical protein
MRFDTVNPEMIARHLISEFRKRLKNANFNGRKHFPVQYGIY